MTVQSMTGFARSQGSLHGVSWVWELRSVNGKGLDVRLRIPRDYDRLETIFRKCISTPLKRGNLQVVLSVEIESGSSVPTINQAALDGVLHAASLIDGKIATSPSTAAEILALRGVLELTDPVMDETNQIEIDQKISTDLESAVADLAAHRQQEGSALVKVLQGNIADILRLTLASDIDPSRTPVAIRQKIGDQLALILEANSDLNSDRLHQEAAMLATKADIKEEIDRLYAHVDAAGLLLAGEGPVGRKLDFLCQEFNREANTLCSKSNAVSLTNIGLELKVVIDQFREQVQNLE